MPAGTDGSAGFAKAVLEGCNQDTKADMVHRLHWQCLHWAALVPKRKIMVSPVCTQTLLIYLCFAKCGI